jgi:putative membrane protein insertion efficiency factor
MLWRAGAPSRWLLIGLIRAYRLTLSGAFGGQCRFSPTCSVYAEDAIRAHGAIRGVVLSGWRILRCNPFGAGGIDRVPRRHTLHDAVIPSADETKV